MLGELGLRGKKKKWIMLWKSFPHRASIERKNEREGKQRFRLLAYFEQLLSISNSFTHFFIHFFTHTYIKNIQTILLKFLYQTPPKVFQVGGKCWIFFSFPFSFFYNNILVSCLVCKLFSKLASWVSKTRVVTPLFLLRVSEDIHPTTQIWIEFSK